MPFGQSRQKAEFEALALPYLDQLFSAAMRLTRSERDAEDLVQDTFLRACRAFGQFQRGSNVRAWLFRILNNTFINDAEKYPNEAAVAEILQQYWVNFAKTGNPNGKGLPYWPTFDKDKATTMQFSNGASLIMVPNRKQIDFVDRFYKAKREETEGQRR